MNEFISNRTLSAEARLRRIEDFLAESFRLDTAAEEQAGTLGGGVAAVAATAGGGGGGGGPVTLAGDVEGPSSGTVVVGIQEVPITTPVAGDNLKVPVYVSATPAIAWRTPPWKTVSKTTAYTATADDCVILCDASGSAFTVTLPAIAGTDGRVYLIKKTDTSANAVTVDGNAAETIDGAATYVITIPKQSVTIVSDGGAWHIV